MESLLQLPGLSLPTRIEESPRPVAEGLLLAGGQVSLLHPFGATRFYRHGWQSWSPSRWMELKVPPVPILPPERRPQADDPAYALAADHGGSGLGALEAPGGKVLLLGALAPGARIEVDGKALRGFYEEGSGEWFLGYGDEEAIFDRYAALLAERLGRRGQGASPRIWCSWYSYYQGISAEILAHVLEGLRGLPFEAFQVDDGWQQDIGDWEANARFPAGMEALARQIVQAGFIPGLWLAPLLVRPSCRLCHEHPDWLLRDERGAPVLAGFNWGQVTHALDVTHPEVEEWLTALIRKVLGWGYRYLKLDFLYAGALPGVRRQKLHRELAYRQALALIRDAAADAYILACGAPVLASLGLADALRVGPDAAPFWDNEERTRYLHDLSGPGALNALRTSLHRLWLRPLVHVDPDVAYFRSRYNLLTPRQRAYLRDLALIADFKATSDPAFWLDPEEREALIAFLKARPQVRRLGRYRFSLAGVEVDYSTVV